ncbi:MAG: hypothetical protein R3F34_06020 [Planctomycetota bacterium]
MIVAALASFLALERGLDSWRRQAAATSDKTAFYLAEAGLAEALVDLRAGGTGNVGTRAVPALFGTGSFWVETVVDENGVAFTTSTGIHGASAERLSSAVRKPDLPLASRGFYGQYGVTIGTDTVVQTVGGASGSGSSGSGSSGSGGSGSPGRGASGSSGSSPGGGSSGRPRIALPEPLPVLQEPAVLVGSDGTVELGQRSSVLGTVVPGPDTTVGLSATSTVTGSTVPERDHRDLPAIAMPKDASTGDLTCSAGRDATLDGGTHSRGAIVVLDGATLTLVGPLALCADSLLVQGGGTLAADTTDGPVHVYLRERIVMRASATIDNTSGDASKLVVLVDGRESSDVDGDGEVDAPVYWRSAEPVALSLYAPHSAVELPDAIHWQGGVCAQTLTVGSDALLELDEDLLEVSIVARDYERLSWRILPIPADERELLARDPVALAIARGDTPLRAADAHIAAASTFAFQDSRGRTFTYSGDALTDVTVEEVAVVVPVVAETSDVPEFSAYTDVDEWKKGSDEDKAAFTASYEYLLRNLPAEWVKALETGSIPPGWWTAIVVGGLRMEPLHTLLSDPTVREDLDRYLENSWLPARTQALLRAAVDLVP